MKWTISKKGLILVSMPLLFQAVFLLLLTQMQEKNAQAQVWSARSQEVLTQGYTVLAELLTAENALRGYLLTGDPIFVKEFHRARRDVPRKVEHLKTLVADHPEQYLLAKQIQERIVRLMKWSEDSAALIPKTGPKRVKARVKDPVGKELLHTLQEDLKHFLQEEKRLDEQQAANLEDTRHHLTLVLLAGGLGGILLTGVMMGLFSRNITGRIIALAANTSRFGRGEPLAPCQQGSDEIAALDATFHDMVAALTAAAQRERSHKETLEKRVAERTAALTEVNHQLSEHTAENEMFVYSVSHDLRSPLVNLQGFSQELVLTGQELRTLFSNGALPAELRVQGLQLLDHGMAESLHFIQAAVKRLGNIIDALLRLSRAGRVEYQWQWVEVSDIVGRIVEAMAGTIAQRNAVVQVQLMPPIWGDPTALEQVFANLLANALHYLDPKRRGQVLVGCLPSATPAPGMVTYFVRDNGLGIAAAYQAKVFQVFQRVHIEAGPGEGMGLAIVQRIVERHRGKVWLESQPGEGSTFFIALPPGPDQESTEQTQTPSRGGYQEATWQRTQ